MARSREIARIQTFHILLSLLELRLDTRHGAHLDMRQGQCPDTGEHPDTSVGERDGRSGVHDTGGATHLDSPGGERNRRGRERLEAIAGGDFASIAAILAEIPGAVDIGASSVNPTAALRRAIAETARSIHGLELPPVDPATPVDLIGPLFLKLVPAGLRRALGEHYTPGWLVEHLLDVTGWPGDGHPCVLDPTGAAPRNPLSSPDDGASRMLDPACGAGIFLVHALSRLRRARPHDGPIAWLDAIRGIDIQPHAVRAARLNLRYALRDVLDACPAEALDALLKTVVVEGDALQLEPGQAPLDRPFTLVAGNPPWVRWERLPAHLRGEARALWEAEGLFNQIGWRARMGAAKKDLSMLFVALAGSRWLEPGGQFAFVLPRSLATSAAASGLRTAVSRGRIALDRIEDLGGLHVFQGAIAPVMLWFGRRPAPGGSTLPPSRKVPWIAWQPEGSIHGAASASAVTKQPVRLELTLTLFADSSAPWGPGDGLVTVRGGTDSREDREENDLRQPRSGPASAYRAYEGANTGGANGIFWIEPLSDPPLHDGLLRVRNRPELGRRPLPRIEADVDASLVHPLLRGRDVRRWSARPSGHVLLVQDPETRRGIAEPALEQGFPATLEFLRRFRSELETRPLYRKYFRPGRDPWYSFYNVGTYTLSAWKVVWREQASCMTAAVSMPDEQGRCAIPDHKLLLVACRSSDEAHYLAAVLNAPAVAELARRVCQSTSIGGHLLEHLPLPAFDPANDLHLRLSRLSIDAHRVVADGGAPGKDLDAALGEATGRLWARG